uniref:Uncharacterized protein n=1 Tax=viral metagenome TaxID=1070528 RepID=A0A6C0AUR0_9ZZZZ
MPIPDKISTRWAFIVDAGTEWLATACAMGDHVVLQRERTGQHAVVTVYHAASGQLARGFVRPAQQLTPGVQALDSAVVVSARKLHTVLRAGMAVCAGNGAALSQSGAGSGVAAFDEERARPRVCVDSAHRVVSVSAEQNDVHFSADVQHDCDAARCIALSTLVLDPGRTLHAAAYHARMLLRGALHDAMVAECDAVCATEAPDDATHVTFLGSIPVSLRTVRVGYGQCEPSTRTCCDDAHVLVPMRFLRALPRAARVFYRVHERHMTVAYVNGDDGDKAAPVLQLGFFSAPKPRAGAEGGCAAVMARDARRVAVERTVTGLRGVLRTLEGLLDGTLPLT